MPDWLILPSILAVCCVFAFMIGCAVRAGSIEDARQERADRYCVTPPPPGSIPQDSLWQPDADDPPLSRSALIPAVDPIHADRIASEAQRNHG